MFYCISDIWGARVATLKESKNGSKNGGSRIHTEGRDFVEFCRILQTFAEFGRILQDFAGFDSTGAYAGPGGGGGR